MSYLRALFAAFQLQRRSMSGVLRSGYVLLAPVPTVAVLTWIAAQSDDSTIVTYVVVGVFLMVTWNGSVTRMGWALSEEATQGTLEPTLSSQTPLVIVMLGKALAITSTYLTAGTVALATALLVAHDHIDAARPLLLLGSVGFAALAVTCVAFIFNPLYLLLNGQPGFFNAILPFGVVFGGLISPVAFLNPALEVIAHLLPASWATDAMLRSISGDGDVGRIFVDWAAALALSAVYVGITYLLFRRTERRLRITGSLSTA